MGFKKQLSIRTITLKKMSELRVKQVHYITRAILFYSQPQTSSTTYLAQPYEGIFAASTIRI